MKKMIIQQGLPGQRPWSDIFFVDLVSGSAPKIDANFPNVSLFSNTNSISHKLDISPDNTKLVRATSASSGKMGYKSIPFSDDILFQSLDEPTVSFSGVVTSCSTSNEFRAFAGRSPYLYVFDWDTDSLVTVSVTGLGDVAGIKFSPDGQYLAVVHRATPYVRIYKTQDWSFVDGAVAATSDSESIVWSANSQKFSIQTRQASSNCILVYSKDGDRLFASTSGTNNPSYLESSAPHYGQNAAYFAGRPSGTLPKIYKLDFDTYAITSFANVFGYTAYSCAIDEDENYIYFTHSLIDGRYISRIKLEPPYAIERTGEIESLLFYDTASMLIYRHNTGRITGTVRDIDNSPASREILAYDRGTGLIAGKTTSDSLTGNYSLPLPSTKPHDVVFRAAPGEQLNDIFFARVEPEAD